MESPVVVDKPPEYHGSDRGFPFEEEEGSGAWSELAARHPDIAARLRQRPATWARKRRPSSHDATDDFGDSFGSFDRFPFDDIPPEFREHFPSHWNRRFVSRDEPQHTQQSQSPPQQQTTATQTEQNAEPTEQDQQTSIPQYGLRNTVDLGQKSPADPSLVDADERTQRSMSAPPDTPNQNKMSGQNHQEQAHPPPHAEQSSNVRHIPIFVEGRDQPLINKNVDHGTHFGETKPTYVPPPPQPHIDRDQYFADEGPVSFHPPPNFSRTFSTPFNKNYRQGPQPFVQQKVYPQTAFARGASPQRSQSPKPQAHPEEHFIKVPVHHDQPAQKSEPPSRAQKAPQQHQQPHPQQHPTQQQHHAQHHPQQHAQHHPQQHAQHHPQQHAPPQPSPQREQTPPQTKPQAPSSNDPITQILSIQTDVLNLMTEVENFTGSKKDKRYLFLDEMLTRNLIKLDNIETDGKENIRLARKEAIKCIQKCIAVLEAKADSQKAAPAQEQEQSEPQIQEQSQPQTQEQSQTQDVEMKENVEKVPEPSATTEQVIENGEIEMSETTKEEKAPQIEPQFEKEKTPVPVAPAQEEKKEEPKPQEDNTEVPQPSENEAAPAENKEVSQPQVADTRPDENKAPEEKTDSKPEEQKSDEKDKKPSPKKVTKTGKKRDKSKDKTDTPKDSNKEETIETDKKPEEQKDDKVEVMQVDDKGDKRDSQVMDVDGAASQ